MLNVDIPFGSALTNTPVLITFKLPRVSAPAVFASTK